MVSTGVVGTRHEPAEAEPKAERGPEGDSRCFPCPEDVTVLPVIATVSEAGRASVAHFIPSSGGAEWFREGDSEFQVNEWGEVTRTRPYVCELDRARANHRRAVSRAKQKVQDFMVFNQTTKMWTFTYAKKCWSREQCVADLHEFVLKWRAYEHGRPFPYVWVIEQHEDGSFHVHFAVRADHYTDFFALRRLWGHGRIQFDKQRKGRDGSRRSLCRLSSYMTKYLVKGFDDGILGGGDLDALMGGDRESSAVGPVRDALVHGSHRYEVAEGFQPGKVSRRFATHREAVAWMMELRPSLRFVWFSGDDENWPHAWPVWTFEDGP